MARKKENKGKKGKKKGKKKRTVTVVFPSLVLPIPGLPIEFPSPKKKKLKGKKKKEKKKAVKKGGLRVRIDPLPIVFEEEEEPTLREVTLPPDLLADIGEVYCLQLSDEVQSKIECVIGKDLVIDHHWKYVSKQVLADHIQEFGDSSPFYPLKYQIQTSKIPYVMCVYDKNIIADYLFVCVEPIHEYLMYKYSHEVKKNWTEETRNILQRKLYHYKSDTSAKIRFLIRRHAKMRTRRDKVMISIVMEKRERDERQRVLTSVDPDELNDGYKYFETIPHLRSRALKKLEAHKQGIRSHNKQIVPILKHKVVQTEESVKYNKAVQKEYLFMDEIDYRTSRKVINVLRSGYECLSQSLKEFAKIDLYHNLADKYKNLYLKRLSKEELKSGKTLFVSPSVSLDKWTYIRQTIKYIPNMGFYKHISCVSWHPRYLDLFAIAYHGRCGPKSGMYDCIVRQVLHEKYRPEYVIVLWKIGLDMKPLRILESYSEIKALQYNADYPSLLAGANKSGQILLWDMNLPYRSEHPFMRQMAEVYGDVIIPWDIPRDITRPIIESSEVFSHTSVIYDLQWLPSNSKILKDGTTDISENITSGQIVTASEDGTVGLWNLHSPHPVLRTIRKRKSHLSGVAPDVSGFMQCDRHMKPDVKYVVARRGGEPVPVRSVSVNNVRQILVPGRIRTNYFSYKSMKKGSERIRPMMHSNIMAGLLNGEVLNINPKLENELKFSNTKVENLVKDKSWENIIDAQVESFYFRHESPVKCLRRCHFADDMILSVSASSFCVWKEQSKLARRRKKRMTWLHSWYDESVHEVAQGVITVPVAWKRNFDQKIEYTTGEWSTHRAAMIYLVRKDGYVEIWDLREQDKQPYIIMKVGQQTIHHTYPLIFSMKEDQMAFIENFFMYIIKIPDIWKSTDVHGNKYLQRTGSHETWRRTLYASWTSKYVRFPDREIENEIREVNERYERRRIEKLNKDFLKMRFLKAKRLKEKAKCVTWIDKYPFRWWQEEKEFHHSNYLKRKGMPIKWTVIDKRNIHLEYLKKYTDSTVTKRDIKYDNFIYYDWKTKAMFREYFQLYWDIRYYQVDKYQFLYVDEDAGDRDIAEEALLLHLEETDTTVERKREYCLSYKFRDCYKTRRLDDIYKRNIAVYEHFSNIQSKLKSRTKFFLENDHLYRTTYLNQRSERIHQRLEGWKPYVNKTLELWSLYNLSSKPQYIKRVPKAHLYTDDVALILLRWGF